MSERLHLIQLAVDEVYENPQRHEDLIVNLLIKHFTNKKDLRNWVEGHVPVQQKEAA